MGRKDDDDREKLSWREIDQRRNRSRHVSSDPPGTQERTLRSDWAKKQHLREAEKFFQGKKGSAEYKKAHAALHDKYGAPEFGERAAAFLNEFGLPDEWGTLQLLLDLPDPKWTKEALQAMRKIYPQRGLLEQKGFKGRLRVLMISAADKSVRQEAEKILEEL